MDTGIEEEKETDKIRGLNCVEGLRDMITIREESL